MKKGKQALIVAFLWLLGGIHAAAGEKEASAVTEIQSGGISIKMTQYGDLQKTNDWENKNDILPGQEIPIVTVIENLGEDCFIRYSVTGEAKSGQEIPNTCFGGIPEENIRKNGYWYETKQLKHGQETEIFTSFMLPENWIQKEEDSVEINIVVDAIQSRNFKPDFTAAYPWGLTDIQKVSENEKNQKLRVAVPQHGICQVVLEGDKIVTVPDSFFSEFKTLVPGDCIQGDIQIKNQYEGTESLYWKIDSENNLLLGNSELKIEKGDGTVLYKGRFQNFTDGQYNLLGKYQTSEEDQLTFSIRFPEEMDNTYRLLNSKMIWTFRGIPEEQERDFLKSVKTGENNHRILIGLFLVSVVFLVLGLIRKQKNHE